MQLGAFFPFSPFIFTCISYIYSSNLLVPSLPPLSPCLLLFLTFYLHLCPSVRLLSLSLGLFFYLSLSHSLLILSLHFLLLTNPEHPTHLCKVENTLTNKTGMVSILMVLLAYYLSEEIDRLKKTASVI